MSTKCQKIVKNVEVFGFELKFLPTTQTHLVTCQSRERKLGSIHMGKIKSDYVDFLIIEPKLNQLIIEVMEIV